jgi:hypothetical protein
VIDKIVDMLHCHQSQFYEWLPYNTGCLDQAPKADGARRAWLAEQVKTRLRRQADRFRVALKENYSAERSAKVEFAEAFEACEYGARLDAGVKGRLFGFLVR